MELSEYNRFRAANHMPPMPPKSDIKRQHNLHLSPEAWEGLNTMAASMGYGSFRGGNVTLFLEALGRNLFEVTASESVATGT